MLDYSNTPPYRRRRKGRKPVPARDIICKVLTQVGLSDQARRLAIGQAWEATVGPEIASRTAPVSFRRGMLVVKAATSAWQNELTFLGPTIIDRLNQSLGDGTVVELKVIAGHWQPPQKPSAPTKLKPNQEDLHAAREAAAAITDPELRATFERFAAAGSAMAADAHSSRSRRRTSSE